MCNINWLVNQMQVHTPDVDVIRDIYGRFAEDKKSFKDRIGRKLVYREALYTHHCNQFVYEEIYPSNPPTEEEVTEAMNDPEKREQFLKRYEEVCVSLRKEQ